MNIYELRPFKTRNADEYELEHILELFINPRSQIHNPFEFENSIIKGQMGSGKTMFLRSNYAFHLYSLVPNLIENKEFVLPIFIRLSDFQHLTDPQEIYSNIMLKILKEMAAVYKKLADAEGMAAMHKGMKQLPGKILKQQPYHEILQKVLTLEVSEYKEKIKTSITGSAGISANFFKAGSEFVKNKESEFLHKKDISISDIQLAHETLLQEYCGKVLLLLDEAGSLDKSFFKARAGSSSMFETLMNQLRTMQFIRTKIAVYPHSYSDILKETRYGDIIQLQADVYEISDHKKFRIKVLELIRNYLSKSLETQTDETIIFGQRLREDGGRDIVEQLIYSSGGNLRTFVHLLDLTMSEAYEDHEGKGLTTMDHAHRAVTKYSNGVEGLFTQPEKDFLNTVVKSCKARSTYRFQFPNMSPILSKYTSKSSEINVLNILEVGSGRKGTTYAFDYTYCIAKDIPTHWDKASQKIDKNRSFETGTWITRVQKLSNEIIDHAQIDAKVEGTIDFVHERNAFIVVPGHKEKYFMSNSAVISEDKKKLIVEGKRVLFYPTTLGDGSFMALAAEILD